MVVGASGLWVNKPVLDAQQTLFTFTWQAGKEPSARVKDNTRRRREFYGFIAIKSSSYLCQPEN
jgi:hypothetical protein